MTAIMQLGLQLCCSYLASVVAVTAAQYRRPIDRLQLLLAELVLSAGLCSSTAPNTITVFHLLGYY